MNLTKKKLLMMDIRLLVHQEKLMLIILTFFMTSSYCANLSAPITGMTNKNMSIQKNANATIAVKTTQLKFSQPFNKDDEFKPISSEIGDPNSLLNSFYTPTQYLGIFAEDRIEKGSTSTSYTNQNNMKDLKSPRVTNIIEKNYNNGIHSEVYTNNKYDVGSKIFSNQLESLNDDRKNIHNNKEIRSPSIAANSKSNQINNTLRTPLKVMNPFQELMSNDGVKRLQTYLLNFVHEALSRESYELFSGFRIDSKFNKSKETMPYSGQNRMGKITKAAMKAVVPRFDRESFDAFDKSIGDQFRNFIDEHVISINVPRAMETGRLFIFKGLKKLLWPLFIGVQIAKSILLALFLPSILGSLGKMVGKGITQVSGFNHPSETVSDFDFKDNSFSMDDDKFGNDYSYPRPEASQNHFTTQLFDKANMKDALSRFGLGDQKMPYVNTGQNSIYTNVNSKNSNSIMMADHKNKNKSSFKDFLKVPSSSLLLSNYDPFYSPLLSRIDSVFAQLGLAKGQESCRERLICLMYSHPAKYAPYSNLVSAQLSRELNELRKPTSDNEEILRFFKYMRAAKDGQDGVDCEKSNESCKDFKDSDNPVMINTYNDINKLVQARKLKR